MSFWPVTTALAGGIGLFLLGMWLMTDGLKMAAGERLRHILRRGTGTPMRGLLAGALVTSLVQSSSAVTVATIGFVNAGLLTLVQAIWVVFGSNVGTTMTSWLVALVGFNIKVEAFALPAIGAGMLLRLTGAGTRRGAAGETLAGFGVFFLGIGVLKDTFSALGGSVDLGALATGGFGADAVFVGIGFLLTLLTQSSSASMAIALTAAAGGLIPLEPAAAVVIGANVGTTSTAVFAAIGATPGARRVAAAHVIFNLLIGVVAYAILPWFLGGLEWLRLAADLPEGPATVLALFHTTVKCLGVALIWAMVPRLVAWLSARFVSVEEDESRPRHLDANVAAVPAIGVGSVELELRRVGGMAAGMLESALSRSADHAEIERRRRVIETLVERIGQFASTLYRAHLGMIEVERLAHLLRASQHYSEMAELAVEILDQEHDRPLDGIASARASAGALRAAVAAVLSVTHEDAATPDAGARADALARVEATYQDLKTRLLRAGAEGEVSVSRMAAAIREIALMRRAAERAAKAAARLDQTGAKPAAPAAADPPPAETEPQPAGELVG